MNHGVFNLKSILIGLIDSFLLYEMIIFINRKLSLNCIIVLNINGNNQLSYT